MTTTELAAASLLGSGGVIGSGFGVKALRARAMTRAHAEALEENASFNGALHAKAWRVVDAHWAREPERRRLLEHANLMRRGVR